MKKLCLMLSAILMAVGVHAQINSVKLLTEQPGLYERMDFTINLTGKWDNPYLQEEVALDMYLTAPSGKQLVVPCYFESGKSGEASVWKARFTPQETGKYTYYFQLKENGNVSSKSDVQEFTAKATDKKGFLHTNDMWTLKFDNGEVFRGIGENICWESRTVDDSKYFRALHENHEKYNYPYMLPLFAKNGGNFVRMWMSSWNFPIDRQRDFNNPRYSISDEYMNPSVVARLDMTVELAEDLGIYIMLCMGEGNQPANHNFFIGDEAKTRYKNRLRYIVARWGYSPNIGMWEFFNEIDNVQHRAPNGPIPAKDIVNWHAEMSKYLKELDPYGHIRTTSISHRDVEGLNSVADLDINQKHIYNRTSAIPSEILRYEKQFGKPYIIGEFGYEWDWSKNFDDFADGMDTDFKRGLWYGLFSPTPVTPMSWWWEYFENRNMMPYFNGVRQMSDRMLAAGKGSFNSLEATAGKAQAFSVQCGDEVYAYLFNDTNEAVTETLSITLKGGNYQVEYFNPVTCEYTEAGKVSAKKGIQVEEIKLAPKAEAVLVFTPVKK